jgi:hypothetical protein
VIAPRAQETQRLADIVGLDAHIHHASQLFALAMPGEFLSCQSLSVFKPVIFELKGPVAQDDDHWSRVRGLEQSPTQQVVLGREGDCLRLLGPGHRRETGCVYVHHLTKQGAA